MSTLLRALCARRNLMGLALLAFLVPMAEADANKQAEADLKQKVTAILKTRALRGAEIGILVKSLKTNKTLFQRNADMPLNPASNVKLITTLAALQILKPEYRFKTEYLAQGNDLVVKGYGDPSVTTDRLRNVAHQLKLRGVTEVAGNLLLDASFFDSVLYAKGQDAEKNNPKLWAAPVSALSLNRNGFEVFVRPTSAGIPAFTSIEPQSSYFNTFGHVQTTHKGFAPSIALASHSDTMTVQLSGSLAESLGAQSFFRRVTNPIAYFGQSFKVILEEAGVRVKGSVKEGVALANASTLYTDLSPRLSEVVNETNKISSNFMAEMLVKAIAATVRTPATFDEGLAQIRQFLEQKVGLKHGEYTLGNGSGLNKANRFSASQLVRVLEFASKDFEVSSEFMASLSVAGAQGTLSRRLKDPFMQRQLRGKTGTLHGVSALSGYLAGDKDDVLTFAILFAGHKSSAHSMWQIQDEISRKLAKNIRIVDHADLDLQNDLNYEDDETSEDELEAVAGGG
jgi:D-alanyl-D-alanine carboxypeptidase/D-alanyl-D-alanine-endopeptidase (penicillin-binding protein 4)